MKRVLLVSMPFATTGSPSLGLSLLKAALVRDGLPCDVRYLNFDFAKRIEAWRYERICNFIPDLLLGDWIFAASLFGERIPPAERYFPEVLHRLAVRAQVDAYLDDCLANVPWEDYALVGFTSTFQQNLASLALARLLKERYPRLQIAFGGANCEGEMGITLHRLFPFVDYVCSGE